MAYSTPTQRTTYTNTATQKRVISDFISIIDPMEVPLLNYLGHSQANVKKFRLVNTPGTTYEWLEDTYESLSDTVASTNLTNSNAATTMTVTNGAYFQVGDVLQIDSDAELIWVSGISGNTLTIVRGFGGTTNTTHASNGTVYRRTRARTEGADATDSPTTSPTTNYNYSQIFQKTISVSGTRQVVTQYGVPNEYDRELEKAFKELLRDLERVPFYGLRAAGSASAARSCGGFGTFITTNVTTLSSTALTQKNIEDAVQNAWSYGGTPKLLVVNAWAQKKIRDMYSPYVRTERSETKGGVIIDKVLIPPVGELDILVDRWCPPGTMYLLDPDKVGFIPIREFFDEELAKTGDSMQGQVVGEYGFVLMNEKAHAKITGFSTSK